MRNFAKDEPTRETQKALLRIWRRVDGGREEREEIEGSASEMRIRVTGRFLYSGGRGSLDGAPTRYAILPKWPH